MFNPRESQAKTQNSFGGFHRGIVVNNVDELKSGRVQIRVIPFFDGVKDGDLPWAIYADAFMGGLSNNGSVMVPEVDSHVFLFFENMDFRFPVYFAAAPAIQNDIPDIPTLSREDDGTVAAINVAAEKNIDSAAGTGTYDEPDSAYAAEYPHNKVIRTKGGIVIELDDTPSNERIHIYHPSGTRTEINAVGDRVEHIKGDEYKVVIGGSKVFVKGNMNITVDGTVNIKSTGDVNVIGDVIADGISLKTHTHPIATGSSATLNGEPPAII